MIIKLINGNNIWIPTPKLFFKIIEKCNIKLYSEADKEIIETRLNEEREKEHSVLFFNIRINFNVLVDGKMSNCRARILKNNYSEDNCTGCIILSFKQSYEYLKDNMNFKFEFAEEDL